VWERPPQGELVESPDRNSLLGTAKWQLLERQASGSFFDPHSATSATFTTWLGYDRILLLAGAAAMPLTMLVRRLRPVTLALVIGWLAMLRGGYLPFMHVLTLVPWTALIVVGVAERAAGNWRLSGRHRPYGGWRAGRPGALLRGAVLGTAAVALVATVATWTPSLQRMTSVQAEPPLRSATRWVADNVPRDKVLVVHDAIWTDLVHKYGYDPRPIIIYKLDTDPAVRDSLRRIDYLVLPNWYFKTPDSASKYPTAVEARKHAVTVATFGTGDDGVTVYRVSSRWRPT
jgi:hypothetical protein